MNQQQSQQRATAEPVHKRSREAARTPTEPAIPEVAGDREINHPAGLTQGHGASLPGQELGGSKAAFLAFTTSVIASLVAFWASEPLSYEIKTYRDFRYSVVVVGALTVGTLAGITASSWLRSSTFEGDEQELGKLSLSPVEENRRDVS
jgi:hypothetical protein